MIRACLISSGKEEYYLVIIMHHIASDGWSSSIFKNDLSELYRSFSNGEPSALPELPYQYSNYALWQRNLIKQDSFQSKIAFWKSRLQDTAPIQLPTDFTRPAVLSNKGNVHRFVLDSNLVSQLREIGKSQKTTLFMTLLAAYKILLYRYSGQEDICVGTPLAGRENREMEDLIGFFVNTLAMRTQMRGSMGFEELLKKIRTSTLEAFEFQQVPFEIIVEALGQERDLSRNPIFQVLFVLQNFPDFKVKIEGAELTEESFDHLTSQFDMTFELTEVDSGIVGIAEYNTNLYRPETIENFVNHFIQLLESIIKTPFEEIGKLKILSRREEIELTESFNSIIQTLPDQNTILDFFHEQVKKSPDAIAVLFEGKSLTYDSLNKKSNQLANYLLKKNVRPESLIPICLDRSFEMIIGILSLFFLISMQT
jgi:non-ribosomal peptide synthetase component F